MNSPLEISRRFAKVLFWLPALAFILTILGSLPFFLIYAKNDGSGELGGPAYVQGELIVKFKKGQLPDQAFMGKYHLKAVEKILKQHKFKGEVKEKVEAIGLDRYYLVHYDQTSGIKGIINELNQDPRVEYAEPNYYARITLLPNDPKFSSLWGMDNTGQTDGTPDADIDAPEAWKTTTGTNLVIGVIDTGVDYNHEDLAANMWTNPGEIPNNGIDDDGNGFIDDVYGWDFYNNDNDPFDDHSHGTHCAGTIGAVGNNGTGVVGVNWSAKIAALKFLSASGSGYTSDAVKAVQYANMMGFKITSNSWGGGGYSQALYDAISAANGAGNLFIAAAGNYGADADESPLYPAAYDLPNIISVAATDDDDLKASFSNYGATSVDLGAPGVSIYSTIPGNSYGYKSGTSMATPHVSGAAGLLWGHEPSLNHLGVKDKILSRTDPIDDLRGITVSGGRLNIYNFFTAHNDRPVADANGPYSGIEGQSIAFDGSGSYDRDGFIVSYEWDFGDGSTGNGVTVTHTYATPGEYIATLTVTDDGGATGSDETTVNVDPKMQVAVTDHQVRPRWNKKKAIGYAADKIVFKVDAGSSSQVVFKEITDEKGTWSLGKPEVVVKINKTRYKWSLALDENGNAIIDFGNYGITLKAGDKVEVKITFLNDQKSSHSLTAQVFTNGLELATNTVNFSF